ncbi:hypothetical protein E2C01_056795 [Portunus trituberculatus]|uniref:Uncharacterized protein n=1 Tax=Portunus trituberculatus TaxID=210409 RepID=A0A5B7GYP5_PORTR|nr:hypothetical protein [Portunus trituberculatus]
MTTKMSATTTMAGVDIAVEGDFMDCSTSPTFPTTTTKPALASPPRAGQKTPRTDQNDHHHPEEAWASFLLLATTSPRLSMLPT